MEISFDPAKNQRNLEQRGLSFERVAELDWTDAIAEEDTRRDYGERRIRILAKIGKRLHAAVVTMRGETVHVISFGKANDREARRYEQARKGRGIAAG